jgi:uncharacterized membrane protein YkoI
MRTSVIWITSTVGAVGLIAAGTAVALGAGTAPAVTASPAASAAQNGATTAPSPAASASALPSDIEGAIAAALQAAGPGTVIDADVDDNPDYAYEIEVLLDAGGVVEVKLDSSLNVVSTQEDDRDGDDDSSDGGSSDDDAVPAGPDRDAAAEAALAHVGSGTVVSVELSDDADHVYEVEIDLGNGDDVDVELDASFTVVKAD